MADQEHDENSAVCIKQWLLRLLLVWLVPHPCVRPESVIAVNAAIMAMTTYYLVRVKTIV